MNETSNSSEPQKTVIIKILAIIGFIVALVFVAWLAVQAVRLTPVAFNTLASIAHELKKEKTTDVTIATATNTIGSGAREENKPTDLITVVNPPLKTSTIPSNANTSATSSKPTTASSTKPSPRYTTVPIVVTTYPVSNPNGYSDLAVTFIGTGTYNASTKKFTTTSFLNKNTRATLRFEVKNIGTKTSDTWYFNVSLPITPAFTYSSPVQVMLKPNERQMITLQFDTGTTSTNERVTIAVTGGNDTLLANNSFTKKITVSN